MEKKKKKKVVWAKEGFHNVDVNYLGGSWVVWIRIDGLPINMEDKNGVDDCNLHEEDIDSVPPVKNWLDRDDDVRLQEGVKGKDEEINEQQGINNIEMQEGNSDETTPSKPPGFEEKNERRPGDFGENRG
nr:RNA-directed DNA polymerase, eukaryota [Tanacetum cinerariifolium]